MRNHQNRLGNVTGKSHKYQKHILQFLTKEQVSRCQTDYPSLSGFECNGQVYSLVLDSKDSERLRRDFEPPHYLSNSSDALSDVPAKVLIEVMESRALFLACAESCTGGAIAALFSSIAGSSKVFWGSSVVYSDDAKVELLGVSPSHIQRYGSISPQSSQALQEAIAQKSKAGCTLGVSGVAGPGKVRGTEPGNVYIVIASPGKRFVYCCNIEGNRHEVVQYAVQSSCFLLYEQLIVPNNPLEVRNFDRIMIRALKLVDLI